MKTTMAGQFCHPFLRWKNPIRTSHHALRQSIEIGQHHSGIETSMPEKLNIAILLSGSGSNAKAIMDQCQSGAINATVLVAGSDNKEAGGLARAHAMGVPTFVVDYPKILKKAGEDPQRFAPKDLNLEELLEKQSLFPKPFDESKVRTFFLKRAAAERELLDALSPYKPELIVLAGFMRTLSPYFIDHIQKPDELPGIMNIHPALLPAFPGLDGYGDTFRHGCKVAGCTVHFVDYGEDSGAIIGQTAFPIEAGDSLEDVKKKGLSEEWKLYPRCIQLYAEKKLAMKEERQRDGRIRRIVTWRKKG